MAAPESGGSRDHHGSAAEPAGRGYRHPARGNRRATLHGERVRVGSNARALCAGARARRNPQPSNPPTLQPSEPPQPSTRISRSRGWSAGVVFETPSPTGRVGVLRSAPPTRAVLMAAQALTTLHDPWEITPWSQGSLRQPFAPRVSTRAIRARGSARPRPSAREQTLKPSATLGQHRREPVVVGDLLLVPGGVSGVDLEVVSVGLERDGDPTVRGSDLRGSDWGAGRAG